VEEVVIKKHAVTEQQPVEADVRRERAIADDSQVREQVRTRDTREDREAKP
jgi:hypothetical protein